MYHGEAVAGKTAKGCPWMMASLYVQIRKLRERFKAQLVAAISSFVRLKINILVVEGREGLF